MKRKVIKQGHNTLTMTLPRKWVEKHNVKPGDELEADDAGKDLVIRSGENKTDRSVTLKLESNNELYIKEVLRNIYLKGYDEVHVKIFDKNSINHLNKIVDEFLGYHIVEQSKETCLIKNLSQVISEEFPILLRKVFLLNKNMFTLMLDDFKANKISNQEQIKAISKNVQRFSNYCRRTLAKKPLFDELKSRKLYFLISHLIGISNSIIYIYEKLSKKKKIKINKECLNFIEKTFDYYILFYNTFFEQKLKNIHKLAVRKEEMLKKELPELLNKNNENNIILHFAGDLVRDIARNIGSLYVLKEPESVNGF